MKSIDVETSEIEVLPALMIGRYYPLAALLHDSIYVLGDLDIEDRPVSTVER